MKPTLESMRRRSLKIIRETLQFICDVEWWNANRTDAPPLDCEGERVLLKVAREQLAAADRGDMLEAERLSGRMLEIAKANVDAGGRTE